MLPKSHWLIICLAPLLSVGCRETPAISISSPDYLSPRDLRIDKVRFEANPSRHEVVVLRSVQTGTYPAPHEWIWDQIYWTREGSVEIDILVAPRSFYIDRPEPEEGRFRETVNRDRWRIRAGIHTYDVADYALVRMQRNGGGSEGVMNMVFTRDSSASTEDLILDFNVSVITLDEALRRYPRLEADTAPRPGQTSRSWTASYRMDVEKMGLDRETS